MVIKILILIAMILFLVGCVSALPVVPELYGFGTDTRAAYGAINDPVIFVVTDLTTDNGVPGDSTRNNIAVKTGSFLEAVNYIPPTDTGKIIVFEVSGTIGGDTLTSYRIGNLYTSILGQTAPSPGIVLKNSMVNIRVSDVLIQHIRIRGVPIGAVANNWDPFYIGAVPTLGYFTVENVVADHLSVSWGRDETGHIGCQESSAVQNITISNSIFSEALKVDTNNGKGFAVWGSSCPARNLAFIGNLFTHNYFRNPVVYNPSTVIVNNLIYNVRDLSITISAKNKNWPGNFSIVSNVIKGGPWSTIGTSQGIAFLYDLYDDGIGTNIYLNDNQCDDGLGGTWTQNNPDNWWDGTTRRVWMKRNYTFFDYETPTRVATPPIWPTGLNAMPSSDVEAHVITNVGARPADRDSVDSRVVGDITAGTGNSDHIYTVPGWPVLAENTQTLTIPTNPHADDDSDGYTNFEEWIHGFSCDVEGPQSPSCLVAPLTCQSLEYNCCDFCESGAQPLYDGDCPGVCCGVCATSSCGLADTDTDGFVSINEVINYITQWKAGNVNINDLINGITEWKNGC